MGGSLGHAVSGCPGGKPEDQTQALDVVRVVGNEAVHPGTIDLRGDHSTATQLFRLVNLIAETMISQPKHVAELYAGLPPSQIEAIERRDAQAKAKIDGSG